MFNLFKDELQLERAFNFSKENDIKELLNFIEKILNFYELNNARHEFEIVKSEKLSNIREYHQTRKLMEE